jgi:hypothetical protein
MKINHVTAELEVTCCSCGEKATHEVTYSSEPIHHLRCSACRAVNAYRFVGPEGGAGDGASDKLRGVLQDHEELMQQQGSRDLQAYRTTADYKDGQYIEHAKFGRGYVLAIFGPPMKMEVLFADRKRLHVCGPGSINSAATARKRRARGTGSAKAGKAGSASKPTRKKGRPRGGAGDGASKTSSGGAPVACKVCGRKVHPANLLYSVKGVIVGCMYCR